jgi:kynurenine formamidase
MIMMANKATLALGLAGGLVLASASSALDLSNGRWVDLTHPFSEETIYWPTADGFEKETVFEGETEGGYYYSAFNYRAAEHGGTHLDAPVHFAKGRRTADQIPIEQLLGPAVVINVSSKAEGDRDYQITPDDVLTWEAEHGEVPVGAIVLFNTGSARFWPDRIKYMGTDERGAGAVAKLHFPGIRPDTARFLAEERAIGAVGLDTPSIDYGQSKDFMTHRILSERDIPGFENVANLDGLPPTGATVVALPMKIKGGSGGPLRIVAFVPNG